MRRWLAFTVQLPFVAMIWAACNSDNGTNNDASTDVTTTTDAAADKKTLPDTGGPMPDTGSSCMPGMPVVADITWTPPRPPNPAGCSDAQIQGYFTACLPGTSTSCMPWIGSNMDCYNCLFSTAYKDSTFGPIISNGGGVVYANTGGCIALELGDTSSTGCGATTWELSECEDLSCSVNCPLNNGDPNAFMEYQACTTDAETSTCDSYYTKYEACASGQIAEAGAALAPCNLGASTFQDLYTSIATVFCGGYPADAGPPPTDGGSDAAAEASTDAAADAPDGD
jgi:hypothetical protein